MNIVWIYDQPIIPNKGGSERVTYLVSQGLKSVGIKTIDFLIFNKKAKSINTNDNKPITDLYAYLKENEVDLIINQIGYASWILHLFLQKGGEQWKHQGGKIISVMHFSPIFPPNSPHLLLKEWKNLSLFRKIKRIIRILLLPYENKQITHFHQESYKYIYDNSDAYVLLSKQHFSNFIDLSKINNTSKLYAISNPLTYDTSTLKINLPDKKKKIIIVSRLDEEQKRISFSLKAWKKIQNQCPQWTLEIIGTGDDEGYYKDMVQKMKLKQIIFHGHQEPLPFYKEASILLFTSPQEGWGLTLTEAMECGVVPIVMDSCPVFKEILNNGECGILTKDRDIKQFSNCIISLTSNEALRMNLAQKCIEFSKTFELNKIIDKWEKLILLLTQK